MKKIKLNIRYKKLLADRQTPVGIYLRLRDRFAGSLLLESSDHHGQDNARSYICCDPIARIKVQDEEVQLRYPDGTVEKAGLNDPPLDKVISSFLSAFSFPADLPALVPAGLFGYTSYEAAAYFEGGISSAIPSEEKKIPLLCYSLYRFVIAIDHFRDELYLVEYGTGEQARLPELEALLRSANEIVHPFILSGQEGSRLTDEAYREMVKKGKEECKRGNVFQVVLSREFSRGFKGDEFNVFRALRTVNPSPYLFYYDHGDFRIFGSSPEAQLVIHDRKAQIHPIAGTFRRTGVDEADRALAVKLKEDRKEQSEHVMLVDLARNDLSRNCGDVKVEVFAETQFYSHVIHLVSKVTGKVKEENSGPKVFAETFPAGTLSGAPKVRAMQIIAQCEQDARGYYGGAIGYLGFNGDLNQAIIIRSFLSRDNTLFYRAGAGVTIASSEQLELEEVNNKLGALRRALELAEEL